MKELKISLIVFLTLVMCVFTLTFSLGCNSQKNDYENEQTINDRW